MTFPLDRASELPPWRRPAALLMLMAFAMPLAFATWSALLNNFTIEMAGFDGADIGWLHTVREIPGFLAIGVIFVILFVREQVLALVSLILLGVATALTAQFPSLGGLLFITLLSSIGFHYYETVNQSLQLQWLPKDRAPRMLGTLLAIGSGGTLLAYGAIVLTWRAFDLSYDTVYWLAGGATAAIAVIAWLVFPQFESPHPQTKKFILRRRYWLYYALQFMSGARRQIFIVFAGFMMVERYGLDVHQVTALFMGTLVINMLTASAVGRAVGHFGERAALIVEYAGLGTIFVLYAGLYVFDWGVWMAAALYVANHVFFSLALAIKTYFQKIADPGDIAPTAAVAFTINHIAAVFLPAALGYLWLSSPITVFVLAAGMAAVSLGLSTLVPRHPVAGHETVLAPRLAAAE
ncbi:MFS transporter [Jannaschia aquimarina]|uniref:Major Facilitator Superfamily protein n=1 Tax=Jannaschia aquimarina TaxID=935700 RepID=A0A0D1D9E6_9RHOB|nr:MFS transporter [Jannaschia aquimarina]KIT16518.1 Major Facilitator Superfamily protein [Jannaschia aquimarina]SNT06642.1 Major Facilitator Superfamily protein [Jannaschia aquimarina]